MNITHHPLLDIKAIAEFYSEKDGVPVTYVCTSAPNKQASYAADIFYRSTPHPEYGNRYFGIYQNSRETMSNQIMITNCDMIEELIFDMIEGVAGWEYSQHRWDYRQVANVAIDGGRAYTKLVGDVHVPVKTVRVKDGQFEEVIND